MTSVTPQAPARRASRPLRRIIMISAGVALAGLAAFIGTRPATRLIAMNLFGPGYAIPPAAPLAATAQSTAADLSAMDVTFATAGPDLGGLVEPLPAMRQSLAMREGWLSLRGVPFHAGWYSDRSGPLLHRVVSGDFLVETRVRAVRAGSTGERPIGSFNSSGLVIRDPASSLGQMRWVMYNIGFQDTFYGTEAKSTVPEIGVFHPHRLAGFRSASTLWLTPVPDGVVEARLRMCRVGGEIRMYRQLPGETGWQEETRTAATQAQGNGLSRPTPGVGDTGPIRFRRDDMPDTVQVGLITNPGFPPNDGEGQFADLRLRRISGFEACTAPLATR